MRNTRLPAEEREPEITSKFKRRVSRQLAILQTEVHWRLAAAQLLIRCLPPDALAPIRSALYKWAGFKGIGYKVTLAGALALRGAGDTRTPMLCHFVGYWLIGMPLGAALAFKYQMAAAGLWIGLCVGVIVIGSALVILWRRTAQRFSCLCVRDDG